MQRIDLAGAWSLTAPQLAAPVAMTIPGDVHSALLTAGRIPHPYDALNELDVQWVAKVDWTISRSFRVDDALLAEKSVCLMVESLDTLGEIRINGVLVGKTDNLFRRWCFEVRSMLRAGSNDIAITFRSAENAAAALAKALPYPIPHMINPVQSMHRNLIRKTQCHSGWDWGPCLMVAGVYGALHLTGTSLGRIQYVTTTQTHSPNKVVLEVTTHLESPQGGATTLEVSCGDEQARQEVTLKPGLNELTTHLNIANPKLWWPNGHGAQPLYDLSVRVAGDRMDKKLGLRKLEVINTPDATGKPLTFRVNDRDIFAKGANWIPADALPSRQSPEVLEDLLASAAAANMNMIRLWGGGQYESDAFYDLCDAKGLLVWHDLMFSCALYPADREFLDNVRQEVRHQVLRLRDHACIALWCGDNEDVGALNWFAESRANRDRYLFDYIRLNDGVLAKVVEECDPTRTFWPSSPCAGPGDFSDCWHKDGFGDMHYWSVWHENKSFDSFLSIKPRFCSEFGYQSFPSLAVIRTYAREDELNLTSPVMEHHQRNRGGNSRILENMTRYFRVPDGFENFVYVSQILQLLAIKTGVEFWRSLRPACMGTLYWQLNDMWPVCSWASLEYGGNWKLLHYEAKRFYAPLLLSAHQDKDQLFVHVDSDLAQSVSAEVELAVLDFTGKTTWNQRTQVEVAPNSAVTVLAAAVQELTSTPAGSFLQMTLRHTGGQATNTHFFRPYKACQLPVVQVQRRIRSVADGKFEIELFADAPAFFAALEAPGVPGRFSDNALTLLPGSPCNVTFTPRSSVSASDLEKSLIVRHLRASYR